MTPTITSQNNNKYFEKIKGSNCSRVRVNRNKLSTSLHPNSPYGKITNISTNNNDPSKSKNCNGCNNDSGIKLLTERLDKIEGLVKNLYDLTLGLQNSKKNSLYNINKKMGKVFENVDLSSCKLEDLQKLVIFTTNAMSSQTSISPKFIHQDEKTHSEIIKQEEKLSYDNLDLKPTSLPEIPEIRIDT